VAPGHPKELAEYEKGKHQSQLNDLDAPVQHEHRRHRLVDLGRWRKNRCNHGDDTESNGEPVERPGPQLAKRMVGQKRHPEDLLDDREGHERVHTFAAPIEPEIDCPRSAIDKVSRSAVNRMKQDVREKNGKGPDQLPVQHKVRYPKLQ
jgi:hypothetical protein